MAAVELPATASVQELILVLCGVYEVEVACAVRYNDSLVANPNGVPNILTLLESCTGVVDIDIDRE